MAHIRPATPDDAISVARVHIESSRSTYRGILPDAHLDALDIDERAAMWRGAALPAPTAKMHLLVAESDNEIVGFACGGPIREPIDSYDAELYVIYLLASAQHRGIGTALLANLARHLDAEGFQSMAVWVLAANNSAHFYEKTGAALIAEKEIDFGGATNPVTAYGWPSLKALSQLAG